MRSAYRMLIMRRALSENAARSDRREEEKEWSSLWQVMVPSKVRIFIWWLAKYSLPYADVLHCRNMADHGQCALCGATDPWKHSLLECNMARCVWVLESEKIIEHLSEMQEENSRG